MIKFNLHLGYENFPTRRKVKSAFYISWCVSVRVTYHFVAFTDPLCSHLGINRGQEHARLHQDVATRLTILRKNKTKQQQKIDWLNPVSVTQLSWHKCGSCAWGGPFKRIIRNWPLYWQWGAHAFVPVNFSTIRSGQRQAEQSAVTPPAEAQPRVMKHKYPEHQLNAKYTT